MFFFCKLEHPFICVKENSDKILFIIKFTKNSQVRFLCIASSQVKDRDSVRVSIEVDKEADTDGHLVNAAPQLHAHLPISHHHPVPGPVVLEPVAHQALTLP